jgi:NAD(P)-dependent dehydrogenase (short-subunit alcohol dehydrogenase family)
MSGLEGQVALITGAARGQGRSHAVHLARQGVRIVAVDLCGSIDEFFPLATRDDLEATIAAVADVGAEGLAVVGDVRSSASMKSAVESAVNRFGTIDIVVNNAGIIKAQAIDEVSDHTMDVVIDTCLKGVFNTTRFVAPIMKAKRSGRIINIASAAAIRAQGYLSTYVAAKGGVFLATKSWAMELAEWSINVNAIAPGGVDTDMLRGMAGQAGVGLDEYRERVVARHLLKEGGCIPAEDVSAMVVYLAGEHASMITGQLFAVDAGFMAG